MIEANPEILDKVLQIQAVADNAFAARLNHVGHALVRAGRSLLSGKEAEALVALDQLYRRAVYGVRSADRAKSKAIDALMEKRAALAEELAKQALVVLKPAAAETPATSPEGT